MKKIILILSTCFLFSLFFSRLSAQIDFETGYYVSLEGDTISGLIAYPDGSKKYHSFSYKSSSRASSQSFQASEAQAYGIGKKRVFQRKTAEEKVVFMELILEGKVSLYQLNQKYYVQYEKELKHIFIEENKVEKDGENFSQKSTHHKEIMIEAFEGCQDMVQGIFGGDIIVLPRQKLLIKLIEDYHDCIGAEYVNYKRIPWAKFKFGAQAGGEFTQLFLSTKNTIPYIEDIDFNHFNNWYASLSLEYMIPRLSERMSFVLEPGFRRNFFQGYNKTVSEAQIITYRDYVLKFREISFPFGFKYILNPRLRDVFVAGGLVPQFYQNQDYLYREEIENLATRSVQYSEPELRILSDYQIGVWIRGGFNLLDTDRFNIPVQLSYQNIAGLIRSPFLFAVPPYTRSYVRGVQHTFILTCGIQF